MRAPVADVSRPPAIAVHSAVAKPVTAAPRLVPVVRATASHPKPDAAREHVLAPDHDVRSSRFSARIRAGRMYPDIVAADRELREAYARAEYVGLNPKLLRMFRDRWWQVRKDLEPDPAYAIEAYYQLAREIDAARRQS
jgi:hypothetical protein